MYRKAILLTALAGALAVIAFAQIRSATITGRVTDPSGGAIPGAGVSVLNTATNISFRTQTSPAGDYTAPYLQAGKYTVTISSAGFAQAKVSGVEVGTGETVRVDQALKLTSTQTTVEVSASLTEIQTESAIVQKVVGEQLIDAIPSTNSNPLFYATLQAGVVARANMNDTQGVNSFGIGVEGRRAASAFTVNGGEAFTNDIQVDGVSVQGSAWNEAGVIPSPEAIQEVRALTNTYSAEYGRGQGVIMLTTKSGSNDFHGSLFHRLRNEAFNANSFLNQMQGLTRPAFKVNYFGGTLGGRVVRDKLFFFTSYEGLIHKRAIDYLRRVPTSLERNADFSQTYVNVAGVPSKVRLFDPWRVTPTASGYYERAEIPNARIPNPNPFILKLGSYFPEPNRTPDDIYNNNNFYRRASRDFQRNTTASRVDYHQGRNSLYGTIGTSSGTITTGNSWAAGNPFFSRNEFLAPELRDSNPYGSIGDTITLAPTLLADIRYNLTRINTANEDPLRSDMNYSEFGIPAEIQTIIPIPGAAPQVAGIGPFSNLSNTNNLHKREQQLNHVLTGSITKSSGRWTLKWGGEFRLYLLNTRDPEQAIQFRTNAAYTAQFVQGNGTATPSGVTQTGETGGLAAASLLMGVGDLFIKQGRSVHPALATRYGALYTQNTWRTTDKLTLSLGLRWDVQPGPTDRFDRITGIDRSGVNPFGGKGAISFTGRDGRGRNLFATDWKGFGPQLGVAYRLADGFVIRGGYGMVYLPTNTGTTGTNGFFGMEAFSNYIDPLVFPNNDARPAGPFNSLAVNRIRYAIGADSANPTLYGNSADTTFKYPYDFEIGRMQQWNFTLEKELGGMLVSGSYVGTKGSRLPYARLGLFGLQDVPEATRESWRQAYIATRGTNPGTSLVCNPYQRGIVCDPGTFRTSGTLQPFLGYWGNGTVTAMQAQNPYPMFSNALVNESFGYSTYNAMELKLTRRMTKGLLVTASYTWSKALGLSATEVQTNGFADTGVGGSNGFTGNLDRVNLQNNKQLLVTDIPHRFVTAYVYELPFGKNRLLPLENRVARALLGGWRTAGSIVAQSGSPLVISGAADNALYGRTDRIPGVPVEVPKELQRWYDGKTTVTLPSGRKVTPCNYCFLKYNSDAFAGRVVRDASGNPVLNSRGDAYLSDLYWTGNAALAYGDIRGNGMWNWNASIEREFRITERLRAELSARADNLLNAVQLRPAMDMNLGGSSTLLLNNPSRNPSNLQPGQGTNANFGSYNLQSNPTFDPRQVWFELKLRF